MIQSERGPVWQLNGMSANERLQRDLARSLVWPETDFSRQLESLAEVAFFPGNVAV